MTYVSKRFRTFRKPIKRNPRLGGGGGARVVVGSGGGGGGAYTLPTPQIVMQAILEWEELHGRGWRQ